MLINNSSFHPIYVYDAHRSSSNDKKSHKQQSQYVHIVSCIRIYQSNIIIRYTADLSTPFPYNSLGMVRVIHKVKF